MLTLAQARAEGHRRPPSRVPERTQRDACVRLAPTLLAEQTEAAQTSEVSTTQLASKI